MTIGIVHHDSTNRFLPELLASLEGVKYPVYVIVNKKGGYELGALKRLLDENPHENDFFLLHETTVIKDQTIFDIAAQFDGSLAMCPGFASFLGKYRREVLEEVGIPVPMSRLAAIYYESFWNIMYMNLEKKIAMCDEPLGDTDVFVKKFGKKRMLLENSYMKKWKSNWQGFQVNMPYTPK